MAPSFGGASRVGAYAKGSGRWRRAAELARHPRRGFFPFSPDGFGPPCAVRLTILPPSAAQVLSPSAAVVLCVGGSEADYQLTTGRTVVVRANPSSPRRRRRGAGESGGATATASPPGGRVRLWTEGKRLLSIRIVPRVLLLFDSTTPSVCVARAVPFLRRPCSS